MTLIYKKIEEDAPLGHAPDKWFLFMFECSSPTLEIEVCDNVHSPCLHEELLSLMKNQGSWFFPKYNDESIHYFPNDQNNIILNTFKTFNPSFLEGDRPEIKLHQRLTSISWLEDQIQSSRLMSFTSSKVSLSIIWVSCFPTSRPCNSSHHYSHLYY